MPFSFDAYAMDVRKEDMGNSTKWTASLRVEQAVAREHASVAAIDYSPRIAVSSFSYPSFASTYRQLIAGKAEVTPAIQELADALSSGIETPREQARAVHDGVKNNIRSPMFRVWTCFSTRPRAMSILANSPPRMPINGGCWSMTGVGRARRRSAPAAMPRWRNIGSISPPTGRSPATIRKRRADRHRLPGPPAADATAFRQACRQPRSAVAAVLCIPLSGGGKPPAHRACLDGAERARPARR